MPMPPKLRTEEWLIAVGAKDTTARIVRAPERIEVFCLCGAEGHIIANNLAMLLKKGQRWQCHECLKKSFSEMASQRTGEKNPFFGKKHTEETKQKISQANTVEKPPQVYLTKEERSDIYKQSSVAFWSDTEKSKNERARRSSTAKNVLNNPEHPVCARRKEKLKEFHGDATRMGEAKEKVIGTNLERYGHENPMQNKDVHDKAKQTNLQRYGSETPFGSEIVRDKIKDTFLRKYGTASPLSSDDVKEKIKQTNLGRYGFAHPMERPDVRKKVLSKKPMSKPESYINNFLTQRGLDFEYEPVGFAKSWDFVIYENNTPILIIEIDGEYCHGLLCDSNSSLVQGHKDPERFSMVPEGCKYLEVDSRKIKEAPAEIIRILGIDYDAWFDEIYQSCKNRPFPYPVYSERRRALDWKNLRTLYITDEYNDKMVPCNSIMVSFHKSIYHCHVDGRISPFDAWSDDRLLRKCIENRFVYSSVLSSQNIARGFEKNKIAPRITLFQPSLARYLLQKYAPEAKTVVDPFSGFSGRMIGACSLGLQYTGYDINPTTVAESQEIIKYLQIASIASVSVNSIESYQDETEYDVLITCPPYGNKEVWSEGQKCQKADYYIEQCLSKVKAKVYIFVVDNTDTYSENVIGELARKSHLSKSSEKIVVCYR